MGTGMGDVEMDTRATTEMGRLQRGVWQRRELPLPAPPQLQRPTTSQLLLGHVVNVNSRVISVAAAVEANRAELVALNRLVLIALVVVFSLCGVAGATALMSLMK